VSVPAQLDLDTTAGQLDTVAPTSIVLVLEDEDPMVTFTGPAQQSVLKSAPVVNSLQLSVPHTRLPLQSLSLSQSPLPRAQGLELVQYDQSSDPPYPTFFAQTTRRFIPQLLVWSVLVAVSFVPLSLSVNVSE